MPIVAFCIFILYKTVSYGQLLAKVGLYASEQKDIGGSFEQIAESEVLNYDLGSKRLDISIEKRGEIIIGVYHPVYGGTNFSKNIAQFIFSALPYDFIHEKTDEKKTAYFVILFDKDGVVKKGSLLKKSGNDSFDATVNKAVSSLKFIPNNPSHKNQEFFVIVAKIPPKPKERILRPNW